MSLSPKAAAFAASICPLPFHGVTDEALGDVIDAWLADEFASEAYTHIHSWTDEEIRA